MPHCIVEYSAELDQRLSIDELTEVAHQALISSELFLPEDIKTRLYPCCHYRAGNSDDSFIHVVIKLLPGRKAETRNRLSQQVLAAISDFAAEINIITVEVVDLDASYAKLVR